VFNEGAEMTRRKVDRVNGGNWRHGFRKVASYHGQRKASCYEPHKGKKQEFKELRLGKF